MKVDLLNIPLDALTMEETVYKINHAIENDRKINHVVINAGKVVLMQKDRQLYESVVSADLINADGQSIVWAARFLGLIIPERVAGADLMPQLVNLAYKKNYTCYFLGASQTVVEKVVDVFKTKYGGKIIAGFRNGYFSKEDEKSIAREIAESGAQILFVAITSPKKENFLFDHRDSLKSVNFTMGVGGTFDVIAGVTLRAPLWMQKCGLEWLYRLLQEPSRLWQRYFIGNSKFIQLILEAKLKSLRLIRHQNQI
ncbi:MAG: WecB/TagA/CpsF family glycosyltransferase [Saprospiraceae bacterium]|nr:WecB/TagA/CpsF family glycosyltransferase [Saprospiraceae bacterium]